MCFYFTIMISWDISYCSQHQIFSRDEKNKISKEQKKTLIWINCILPLCNWLIPLCCPKTKRHFWLHSYVCPFYFSTLCYFYLHFGKSAEIQGLLMQNIKPYLTLVTLLSVRDLFLDYWIHNQGQGRPDKDAVLHPSSSIFHLFVMSHQISCRTFFLF